MLIQYSRRAQQALCLARDEAGRRGTDIVGSEHLLLALMADPHCVAWRVMNRLAGGGTAAIHADLRAGLPPLDGGPAGKPFITDDDTPLELIPLTDGVQQAVAYARDESRQLGEASVGTGHLLMGLLAEAGSPAAQSLNRHGVAPERVRQEIAREHEP